MSATFEIKINRKTGAFESIKIIEKYHIALNSILSDNITTTSTFNFSWKTADLTNLKSKLAD